MVELTSSHDSFREVIPPIAERLQAILGVERLTIHTVSRTERVSLGLTTAGGLPQTLDCVYPTSMRIHHADIPAFMQQVLEHGTPVVIPNAPTASATGFAHERGEGDRSVLCLPLVAQTAVVGTLTGYSQQPIVLAPDQERMVQACCTLIAQMVERERFVVEREELLKQFEIMQDTDPLTKLYKRRYFSKMVRLEVGRAQRYRRALSCLMFAIDNFQTIVDTYGHEGGETVLTTFAHLLSAACRECDIPSRQTTAQFALLAVETHGKDATILANRLLSLLREKDFVHAGASFRATASVGIASVPSPHIHSAEQLLEAAETALQAVQRAGGDRVAISDPQVIARLVP
jgi:diguanylate cyclase (GGDEF)-like protein